MGPGTVHAVVTPKASICHGGHLYAMSTMSKTVYGILHTFVGSSVLTNTQHTTDSRMLLRRTMSHVYSCTAAENFVPSPQHQTPQSVHLPKFNTSEGVMDFFNLLNMTELGNILNPFSYTTIGLQIKERAQMIHARKLGRVVLQWFGCNYEIRLKSRGKHQVIKDIHHFYYENLGRQTKALLDYKKQAEESGMSSDMKECTAKAMEIFIGITFKGNVAFSEGYNKADNSLIAWNEPLEVRLKKSPSMFNMSDYGKLTFYTISHAKENYRLHRWSDAL